MNKNAIMRLAACAAIVIGAALPLRAAEVTEAVAKEAVAGWASLQEALTAKDRFAGADNAGAQVERTADGETRLVERGHAPVMADGIGFRLTLGAPADKVRCWALAPDGSRKAEVPATAAPDGRGAVLALSPESQTLWYEISID